MTSQLLRDGMSLEREKLLTALVVGTKEEKNEMINTQSCPQAGGVQRPTIHKNNILLIQ